MCVDGSARDLLIGAARLLDGRLVDVMISAGRVATVDPHQPGRTPDLDARGGLLLPGLHDHHVHVAATAAALASVRCGPPEVTDAAELASTLAKAGGTGWLRGIGYHESVAGLIDRAWLDGIVPDRPARIQHRSGRLWIFNSIGLEYLLAGNAPPRALDRDKGHLFDADTWLRGALQGSPPDIATVSSRWSRWGVTGVTDMNPHNGLADAARFAAAQQADRFPQRLVLAGTAELAGLADCDTISRGPLKIHLHDAALPEFDAMVEAVAEAHRTGRGVAVHCVTEGELVFTLAAFREAGPVPGDRIEHASIATPELVAQIAELGLAVVTQPNFVTERGDAYLADIGREDWPNLYRLRSFLAAGVTLAGGTDTPFGQADPWAAIAAAVDRRTATGVTLGLQEALSPEQALDLFLADPLSLGRRRAVVPTASADLCLLAQDWTSLRADPASARVVATLVGGKLVFDGR